MLAKETKIHNLIHQRNFIEVQLGLFNKDGDPAYRYAGYLYPENREYFEKEGYDVTIIASADALKITKGLPLNIFTPSDEIILTPEEVTTSETIAREIANITGNIDDILNQFIDEEEDFEDEDFDETEEDEDIEENIIEE